jgi:integrase/recombinase XerD
VISTRPGEPSVRLVDDGGVPVDEVDGFLRLLAVREYSPNTIRAYAHDLQKLFAFLGEAGIAAAEFTPARAVEFLQWLRLVSSSRRAQRLELGVAVGGGRVLSPKTCNRVMAAVSSFYEFLIASEAYAGRDNPIVKVADQAAARVPGRYRPPLDNASRQQPVRRVLRVKTVEALPRPMNSEVRQKSRRDRVVDLLEGRALPALNDYIMRERPADADCPWVFLVGGRGKRRCEPLSYDSGAHVRPRRRPGRGP